jgi:predicted MFS family arabinose efflux permease
VVTFAGYSTAFAMLAAFALATCLLVALLPDPADEKERRVRELRVSGEPDRQPA